MLSSSLLSALSNRPLAKECPWYQSNAREKGKSGSEAEGLAASRMRVLMKFLFAVTQVGSRWPMIAAVWMK